MSADTNPTVKGFPDRTKRAFERLTVDAFFNRIVANRVLVEWAMEKDFLAPGPYTFVLYRGYAVNDPDGVALATTVDQPWLYDNNPIWPQKGTDVYYWVVLTDGEGRTYRSQSVSGTTYWDSYDWSLAREIIRKEHMVMRKRAGTKGWLLKRRNWGDPCPDVDPVTGEVSGAGGPPCYGTPFLGGYYDPIEYWVIINPTQRLAKIDNDQGLITQIIETVRALAYPIPEPRDVWVHAHTGQRYLILGDISAIARHRGINLILNLRLEEQPRSDPIYSYPMPC